MNEHRREWLKDYCRYRYYVMFGLITRLDGGQVNEMVIEDAETILIQEHQPPFNTSKMKSFRLYGGMTIKHRNRGRHIHSHQTSYEI